MAGMAGASSIVLLVAIPIGWTAALAALYGRYRVLPGWMTGPQVCRLEDGGCGVLFRTREAALLGPPNSLLGSLYYPLLLAGLWRGWPNALLLGAATFAFGLTLWLGRFLLVRDLECRVCWTGHFVNTAIWLVLVGRAFGWFD